MKQWPELRPALAAAVALAVLAGAYEVAPSASFSGLKPKVLRSQPPVAIPDSVARVVTPDLAVATAPPPPPADPADETASPPCQPQPLRFVETSQPGPRRYVGTVGGEPATAELDWSRPDSLHGRFYLWRSGLEHQFSQGLLRHPRVLVLAPAAYPVAYRAGGRWQLSRAAGPVLQGTWVDSAGRHPRPFLLRESYQGGVRYEVRHLALSGGRPVSPSPCDVPLNRCDFLHLLGAAAARPPLSRVQCPS